MGANRYYNPPDELRKIGRLLRPGSFSVLHGQLLLGEVLIAMYANQAPALVAAEVPTADRLDELDRLWRPSEFYALPRDQAEAGFARVAGAEVPEVS